MRKLILSILSILILLSGCGKKITWEDVKEDYSSMSKEVKQITKDIEEVVKDDYTGLLKELSDYVNEAEYSKEENNLDLLKRTYKVAVYLEEFASLFEGSAAQTLLTLAVNVKDLVRSNYDGDKNDFNVIKQRVLSQIEEISSWADDEWSTIEKKAKLTWNDEVEAEYEKLEDEALDSLTELDELSEYELDDLKHDIIDNYELIKDGISEDTKQAASKMYTAAIKLKKYVKNADCKEADKVTKFAKHTIIFVEQTYGKVIDADDIPETTFEEDVASAKKWTQSTWNAITRELQLYMMPKQEATE